MSIDILLYKRRQLESLLKDINQLIAYLDNAINSLDGVSSNLDRFYQIDGNPANKGNASKMLSELINKRNYLKNTALVSIQSELTGVSDEIFAFQIDQGNTSSTEFV